jgi:hypothetical protein
MRVDRLPRRWKGEALVMRRRRRKKNNQEVGGGEERQEGKMKGLTHGQCLDVLRNWLSGVGASSLTVTYLPYLLIIFIFVLE